MKTITATEFKAKCLRIIGNMNKNRESVTITKHGRPVAKLSPIPPKKGTPLIIGAMQGTVLDYSEPFKPATDPSDWSASQ